MKKLTKIFLSVVLLSTFSSFIFAIEYQSLGGRPAYPDPAIPRSSSWFIYDLDKGEQKEDAILVINNYDTALDVIVYAADGIRSSSGGFAIKQFVEEKEAVGAWVKFYPQKPPSPFTELFEEKNESIIQLCKTDISDNYDEDEIDSFNQWCEGEESVELTINSLGKVEIPFIFSVPQDIDVGEHTGGIVIQKAQTEDTENAAGQGMTLTTRVGVRIYETVPGEIIKELKIKSFTVKKNWKNIDFKTFFNRKNKETEKFTIETEIENSGNVSVDFSETLEINDDLFNKNGEKLTERNFQILRGDTFNSLYDWENPAFGKFTISSNVMYTDTRDLVKSLNTEEITVWIIPWEESLIALTIMLLIGIPLIIFKRIRKKKYSGDDWRSYIVKEGDTLAKLSKRYNIKWKRFVKINKIKAPYTLEPGQKVLVPPKKQ